MGKVTDLYSQFWNIFPKVTVVEVSQNDESSIRVRVVMLTDRAVQFFKCSLLIGIGGDVHSAQNYALQFSG